MRSRVMSWIVTVACVALGSGLAHPALAQESASDREARAHFEAARLHFDRGAYEEAQREFEAAYELSHRAELLYNLYLSAERLGDFDAAIGYLERYLSEGAPDDERRAHLTPRLDNLRERHARTTPEEPSHEVATETPPASAPRATSSGDLLPAAIAFGVAGAGLMTFAIVGGLALAEDDALAGSCGVACTPAQLDTLGTLTLVADIGWVTALVAAVTGTVLVFTVGLPGDAPADTASIAPFLSLDGGGLTAQGVF